VQVEQADSALAEMRANVPLLQLQLLDTFLLPMALHRHLMQSQLQVEVRAVFTTAALAVMVDQVAVAQQLVVLVALQQFLELTITETLAVHQMEPVAVAAAVLAK
jgi:hypothetical protein